MFRRSLRSIFLVLMPLLAAAAPALAAADIDEVSLEVTIARSSLVSDEITAVLRVTGTDLNNGTIALPQAPAQHLPLDQDGLDLILEDTFASETELNATLPNGNYILRVNNSTIQATLVYNRPLVPSPAISQPGPGDIVPPGTVELLFTNCAVCGLVGDSVEAVLEDDMAVVLAQETLTSTSEDWIPPDGMGGDLDLPQDSGFVARVTHSALRETNVVPNPADDDGLLVFSNHFVQSDEIDFRTGFEPPVGDFCLAANYTAPPAGCEILSNASLQVLDTSGMFTTQVDGHDVDYTVVVGADGGLSGSATADLDDSGMNETGPAPIKGKLSGNGGGEASSKLSFSLAGDAPPAKLKVSITETLSILGNLDQLLQRASGSISGVKLKEETSSSGALPYTPLGWLIEFELDANGQVLNGMLTLEGGRNFALTGTNKFNFASNQSSLKLSSDPKGISLQLKKLGLDDSTDPLPMQITEGDLSYRMLGQSGQTPLP